MVNLTNNFVCAQRVQLRRERAPPKYFVLKHLNITVLIRAVYLFQIFLFIQKHLKITLSYIKMVSTCGSLEIKKINHLPSQTISPLLVG